jgi:hypothetical protein
MNKPSPHTFVAVSRHRIVLAAAAMLIVAATLWTSRAHAAEPFNRGNISGSLSIGTGQALDQTYTTLGVGLGYMVSDGLMAGISGEAWFGNDPNIYKITPEVRYTFTQVRPVMPYVGTFVSRTFYDDLDDRNSYGVRGGAYFRFSSNAAVNVGLVYEKISNCNEATYKDCSQVYPEAGLLVSF